MFINLGMNSPSGRKPDLLGETTAGSVGVACPELVGVVRPGLIGMTGTADASTSDLLAVTGGWDGG